MDDCSHCDVNNTERIITLNTTSLNMIASASSSSSSTRTGRARQRSSKSMTDEADVCLICIDQGETDHPLFKTPCCRHPMHLDCLFLWRIRNSACPSCRKPTARHLELPEEVMESLAGVIKTILNEGTDRSRRRQESSQTVTAQTAQNVQTARRTGGPPPAAPTPTTTNTPTTTRTFTTFLYTSQDSIDFSSYGDSERPDWLHFLDCPWCNREFHTERALEQHLQMTNAHEVIVCCRRVYANQEELNIHRLGAYHRRTQAGNAAPTTAPQQEQPPPPPPTLNRSATPTRRRQRSPSVIRYVSQDQSTVDLEVYYDRPNQMRPAWWLNNECPYCLRSFNSERSLEQHLQTVRSHPVYTCCGKVFLTMDNLTRHCEHIGCQ